MISNTKTSVYRKDTASDRVASYKRESALLASERMLMGL